jgi:UDP-N-acetylmuramyl pentapeptide synthase
MGEHYIGDIDAICKVVPVDYAIITGATYQHYERFGSEKAIVQTLLEVVDHIKESGIILYNADSELFAAHYKSICPTFNRFAPYSKTDCQNII